MIGEKEKNVEEKKVRKREKRKISPRCYVPKMPRSSSDALWRKELLLELTNFSSFMSTFIFGALYPSIWRKYRPMQIQTENTDSNVDKHKQI